MIDTRVRSSPCLSRLRSVSPDLLLSLLILLSSLFCSLISDRRSSRRKREERRMPRWIGSPIWNVLSCLVSLGFHITRRSESLFIDRLRSCLCRLDTLGSTRRGLAPAIHMLTFPLGQLRIGTNPSHYREHGRRVQPQHRDAVRPCRPIWEAAGPAQKPIPAGSRAGRKWLETSFVDNDNLVCTLAVCPMKAFDEPPGACAGRSDSSHV